MGSPKRRLPKSKGTEGRIHRATCPTCKAGVLTRDLAADKNFPFCSRRCKLFDLGEWFDGEHRITTPVEEEDE